MKFSGLILYLRVKFYYFRRDLKRYFLYNRIISFGNTDFAQSNFRYEISYLKENGLTVFPYPFEKKYKNRDVIVGYEKGMPFVEYFGKRMFFQKSHSVDHIRYYFNSILMEQDLDSPHRYCHSHFQVQSGDTIVDLGVAEGNFSLEHVDRAEKVLLFESNPKWIEALNRTFEPYSDKVEIIHKLVSESSAENKVALDDIRSLKGKPLFIKIDVDGSEGSVLMGMNNLLKENSKIKIAICTYHRQNDSEEFKAFFRKLGFETEFSPGYMLFYHEKKLKAPYFRKGVLRAWKTN
jgi:hypothetical protein